MKREKSLYHNIFHQINQIKEINQMHNSPHGLSHLKGGVPAGGPIFICTQRTCHTDALKGRSVSIV